MNNNDQEIKIKIEHVSKVYKMYNSPVYKMKEAFSLTNKSFHTEFYALTDLSFEVKKGEILGIMGRNGAGKSTLLKIITGILEPSQGNVLVEGRISSLLELGTGFNMEYTGIENIYFYGTLMGISKQQMERKIDEIISFAEIGDYVHQPVKTYSSGMFARLAFSCAINVDPDILIVDEILSVGDMRFQAKCFNKFKEFKDKGVTILYVGHDVSMMRTFCDTALWINNGKFVDMGDPTFICAQYTEFMYLDDISDFTTYKKYKKEEERRNEGIDDINCKSDFANTTIIDRTSNFSECLAHWGTDVGLVKEINLVNDDGQELVAFSPTDKIHVILKFDDNSNIDYRYLSVAISIKNKEGTDLIVKTTYDEGIVLEKGTGKHKIDFAFITRLAKGEYYLVVALENRRNASITYHEYIEGVKYFKIYSEKKIFGVMDVDMEISYV